MALVASILVFAVLMGIGRNLPNTWARAGAAGLAFAILGLGTRTFRQT